MEKRNLFVSGKAVVAAVCGAFTAAFGWLGWLVVAWAACMALDWVSGSAAAASRQMSFFMCFPPLFWFAWYGKANTANSITQYARRKQRELAK